MNNPNIQAQSSKTISLMTNKGFTFVEVMIVVAILGIISAIAIPAYRNYTTTAKQSAARAVMEQFPVLIETYRAENAHMCPLCTNANGGPYTYNYSENDDGTVNTDTITPIFPGFRVKSAASTNATLYHYQVVFTVAGCPACTESAVVTAFPQAGRDAPEVIL
jgi:prepilin-type N-terminal cleavage/methylation domain-containing protein